MIKTFMHDMRRMHNILGGKLLKELFTALIAPILLVVFNPLEITTFLKIVIIAVPIIGSLIGYIALYFYDYRQMFRKLDMEQQLQSK